jgi:hypothetical protein
VKKDDREIMEILEAFDLTRCAHSAAQLVGCDPKTVAHWVGRRDLGLPVVGSGRRARLIDPFLDKVEEWVARSNGHVRADVVHERLVVVGFDGDERTTRRAVAEAKARWQAGHRRTYRPWITEPGMWCQFDWGVGPVVAWAGGPARPTLLFCLWLAWSRFRVVILDRPGSGGGSVSPRPACRPRADLSGRCLVASQWRRRAAWSTRTSPAVQRRACGGAGLWPARVVGCAGAAEAPGSRAGPQARRGSDRAAALEAGGAAP